MNELERYKQRLRYTKMACKLAIVALSRIAKNDEIGNPAEYAKECLGYVEKWCNKSAEPPNKSLNADPKSESTDSIAPCVWK